MEDYGSLWDQAPENILKSWHKNVLEYSFYYFDHSFVLATYSARLNHKGSILLQV